MIFWHLRPGSLVQGKRISKRAVYRYFRDTAEEGVSILLLSVADWRATRGEMADESKRRLHERMVFNLIEDYFVLKERKKIPPLVNGNDIMKKCSIGESPLVGEILRKVREEQLLGNITTKKEAFALAKDIAVKRKLYLRR